MNLVDSLSVDQRRQITSEKAWFDEICRTKELVLGASYFEILFATACWLVQRLNECQKKQVGEKLLVGLSGGQGSGKSTFAMLLKELIGHLSGIWTLILSIDDFYLCRVERQELADSVHPLLATRGVPGTHDIKMMSQVINDALNDREAILPQFSKSEDDRIGQLKIATDQFEIILCEGWCWGAPPASEDELLKPVNDLEAEKDADFIWRRYVNDELVKYQSLFETECSIFLKVPDMASIVNWRWQQEQGLTAGEGVMDRSAVATFVMYYERISRRMLRLMPDKVDLVLELDVNHEFIASKLRQTP